MPTNDLLNIVQQGQVRVGNHIIDISRTFDGRLTYGFGHIETHPNEAQVAKGAYDTFDETLMHALGHMAHVIREHAGGDDSVEGPAADHEVATNLLQIMCAARDLAPRDFIPNGNTSATLAQLHEVLSSMLDEGIDPDTPIRMRSHSREPNIITDPPAAPIDTAWHNADEGVIYLDEHDI